LFYRKASAASTVHGLVSIRYQRQETDLISNEPFIRASEARDVVWMIREVVRRSGTERPTRLSMEQMAQNNGSV